MGARLVTGGSGNGMTATVTSEAAGSAVPLAVNRSPYSPMSLNVAVVAALAGLAKSTPPGPLTLLHAAVRIPPAGNPSSLTEPFSATPPPAVTVWGSPALTRGGRLAGCV